MRSSPLMAAAQRKAIAEIQRISATDRGLIAEFGKMQTCVIQAKNISLLIEFVRAYGLTVRGGPFEGMLYDPPVADGSMLAKLLGTYEADLHPHILDLSSRPYDVVINIGCADGYYAVGLARLMPHAVVHAYEIIPELLNSCRVVASDNGQLDRIHFGERCTAETIASFEGCNTLMVCDIEGGEFELLDPSKLPGLKKMDMIVELHPSSDRSVDGFMARFEDTHECTFIVSLTSGSGYAPALREMGDLDRLAAVCEFRGTPTPWAVLKARNGTR